ncbi:MAG: DUF6689 family protein [Wenzhouxiangella sp.]
MKRIFLCAAIVLCSVSTAWAGLVNPTIQGDKLTAGIELAGGIEAELTIRFESVVGLSLDNLGLSVKAVNPLNPNLLARLPSGSLLSTPLLSVPVAFPVLIHVEPPSQGGLAFEGVVEIELYTQNLQYTVGSPLRLFTAADSSSAFHDITDTISGGSYRTRSGGGHFSQFIILADTRAVSDVIISKFDRLDDLLTVYANEIDLALHGQLSDLASQAYLAFAGGNPGLAITHLDQFRQHAAAGAAAGQLPNVWRSARDLNNVDGELRAAARTLRFSLTLASNLL